MACPSPRLHGKRISLPRIAHVLTRIRVYGPEVLPLHVRAKGNAIGISAIWLWNFFVVMVTPVIITRIQWKAYLIFTVLNYSFVVMLYFFYPELANMTLEEVDDVFTAEMDPVKAAKEIQKRKREQILESSIAEKPRALSPVQTSDVSVEHKQ